MRSTSQPGRRDAKRRTAKRLQAEYNAILALAGLFRRDYALAQQRELKVIDEANNAQLDSILAISRERLAAMRQALGARLRGDEYKSLLDEAGIGPAEFAYIPRWRLEQYFSKISDALPPLTKLPYHALIQLDVHGLLNDVDKVREYRILEASLYEDMAANYNRSRQLEELIAKDSHEDVIRKTSEQKRPLKELAAARRAAVSSAFYFVEAYLNSLAFDTLITRSETLEDSDLVRLAEWDPERMGGKGAERFLSLRDKCIHYPRLRAGARHPIIDENRSQAMRYFLNESKDLRDAIVHATPVPSLTDQRSTKHLRFIALDMTTCSTVVDTAVQVVRDIESAVFGNHERLFWLVPRDSDGLFPASAFA